MANLERQMPNLITFMESPIDQELWERMSATSLLEDRETIETNFMYADEGIKHFIQRMYTNITIVP